VVKGKRLLFSLLLENYNLILLPLLSFIHQCDSPNFSGTLDGNSLLVSKAKAMWLVKTPVWWLYHHINLEWFPHVIDGHCVIIVAPGLFAEWKDVPTPPLLPFSVGFSQLIFHDWDSALDFIELHKRATDCPHGRSKEGAEQRSLHG